MAILFPVEPYLPGGFIYLPGFITEQEELQLHHVISKITLNNFKFHGFEAKRMVASFGYDYSFGERNLTKGKDIPPAFDFLIKRVADQLSVAANEFAELLVTCYPPGSVINWHRDAPPFEIIAGISLMADCTFRLRPHDKAKQNRRSLISLPVQRRSLYIMQGPARSEWEHSITPGSETRYSVTLRTLRQQ